MWLLTSYLYLTAAGLSIYMTGRLAGLRKDLIIHALMGLSILTTVMSAAALLGISAPDVNLARFLLTITLISAFEVLVGMLLLHALFIVNNYRRIQSLFGEALFFKKHHKLIFMMTLLGLTGTSILFSVIFPISKEDVVRFPSGWWFRTNFGYLMFSIILIFLIIVLSVIIPILVKSIKTSRGFTKQEYRIALEFTSIAVILLALYIIMASFFIMTGQQHLISPYTALGTIIGLLLTHYLFFIRHSSYRHAKYRLPRFFEIMGDQAPPLAIIDLENRRLITSTKNFKKITRYSRKASKMILNSLFQFLESTGKKYHYGKRSITFDDNFTLNERHYHVMLTKLPRIELYFLTLTDVTQMETLNEKLQEYVANFNLFLSTAFHELGNALQPIMGFTEILKEELKEVMRTNAIVADSLDTIERNVHRMKELLQLFRLIGKNQANFLDVSLEVMNFTKMVRELIKDYQSQAQVKNITLQGQIPQKDVHVLGDEVYLPVVLVNVLSNAIKYTPNGGKITVTLHDKPVMAKKGKQDVQMICLEIADTGIGIDEDEKEAILNPFKRGKVSKSAFNMGLGLYVANEIIKKHGGRLEIHSPGKNKGTTVKIYLIKAQA